MAFSPRLISLAALLLASHAVLSDAAVRVRNLRANNLPGDASGNLPDALVKVWCGSNYGGRTETIKGTHSPIWAKEFNFPSCRFGSTLRFEVWDEDLKYDEQLGICSLAVSIGSYSRTCTLKKGTLSYSYIAN